MQLTRGAKYRHKDCLDVDMEIRHIVDILPYETRLEVNWVNQRDTTIIHAQGDLVTLRHKDLKNWKRV